MSPLALLWGARLPLPVGIPLAAAAATYLRSPPAERAHGGVAAPGREWARGLAALGAAIAIWAALCADMDRLADQGFAWHMVQHMLLVALAAPLAAASSPWRRCYRGIPRRARAGLGGAAGRLARRGAGPPSVLPGPWTSLAVFAAVMWLWHLPLPYDAALAHPVLHALEHVSLFGAALAFWIHALGDEAAAKPMAPLARAAYLAVAMVPMTALAFVIAFSLPLYARYGGAGAAAGQRLGAGVMIVFGSGSMVAAAAGALWSWVMDEAGEKTPGPRALRSAAAAEMDKEPVGGGCG